MRRKSRQRYGTRHAAAVHWHSYQNLRTEECRRRSVRTLDLFLTRLAELTGGKVPQNFIITLPKVTHPEQSGSPGEIARRDRGENGYAAGSLKLEIMIETAQAIIDRDGANQVLLRPRAANGRCRSAFSAPTTTPRPASITAAYRRRMPPTRLLILPVMYCKSRW